MVYVIARSRKTGTRYTGIYLDADGTYKSAGTYDIPERAQEIAEQTERHHRLQSAETSPADKAAIIIEDFGMKFLKEGARGAHGTRKLPGRAGIVRFRNRLSR